MKWSAEKKVVVGVSIALAVLLVNALISYRATRTLIDEEAWITHSHLVLSELDATLSVVKDAETGVRGFIITDDESYLEPYRNADDQIHEHLEALRRLTADNPTQLARIPVLEEKIAGRMARLKIGVDQRISRVGGAPLVPSNVGKRLMDELRQYVDLMAAEENDLLRQRSQTSKASGRYAFLTDVIPNVFACVLLLLASYLILRDIAKQKRVQQELFESRERLRMAMQASQMGTWTRQLDESNRVRLSPELEEIFGFRAGEFPETEEAFFELVHAQDREQVQLAVANAVENGQDYEIEFRYTRKGEGLRWMIGRGRAFYDAAGRPFRLAGLGWDITERKRAEQDRLQLLASERSAREQAEAASRAKDEFVAMVSHEIRSPLNAILGWAQMLRGGKFDQEQTARAIETIERNAKNQSKLVEDLLDISRVVTGKLRLSVRPIDPAQIMEACLDSIRPAAEAKSIKLHTHPFLRGYVVSGDPDRLQQIVWNLLSNAVKFTPKNGEVQVRMGQIDAHLEIIVRDSGAGIRPEFLPYVFDRFTQGNMTSERKHGGLGLGLAIVRHLVELHGGAVRAESGGDGEGSTFTVTLPLTIVPELACEASPEAPTDGIPRGDTVRLEGLRILVVDDELETRDLLSAILTRRGAEVRLCASAAEALQAAGEWQPRVMLADIGMPDEDGYSLIRKLRMLEPERGGSVPAVALTAYARSEDRTRVLAAGFQMHVSKPVDAIELIMVIASLAGRQAMKA